MIRLVGSGKIAPYIDTFSIPGGLTGSSSADFTMNHSKGMYCTRAAVYITDDNYRLLRDRDSDGATTRGYQIHNTTLNSATVKFFRFAPSGSTPVEIHLFFD